MELLDQLEKVIAKLDKIIFIYQKYNDIYEVTDLTFKAKMDEWINFLSELRDKCISAF